MSEAAKETARQAPHVLVVEDDPATSALVVTRLQAHGLSCALAETGEDALRRTAAEPFDLVLLDIGLPGIDGYEVLAALQAREAPPAVIVMTAYGTAENAHRARAAGAAAFMIKPVRRQDLLEAIHHVLGAPPTGRA